MATIKYKDDSKQYIKELKKYHGGLSVTSAETVNTAAKLVKKEYIKELNKFKLRAPKFTKGAVKIFFARAMRSSSDFRPIDKINSVIGVRKMKGGKEHYLHKQEKGDEKSGYPETMKKVAIPLIGARKDENIMSPVDRPLRLHKKSVQTLHVAGKPLGVPGSPWQGKQSWAILNKYMGTSDSGYKKNPYRWKRSRQFFFTALNKGLGIFRKIDDEFKKIRTLKKSSVRIKATHKFSKSFDRLTPSMMETIFKKAAKKYLRNK